MKKLFILIPVMLLLLGCSATSKFQSVVILYYPTADATQQAIMEISCEGEGKDAEDILSVYFAQQDDPSILQFPKGMGISSLKLKEDHATLILTDHFADLSGIHLTRACVCITKTLIGLTGVSTVTIGCQSALIDGEQSITFSDNTIMWVDEGVASTPSALPTNSTN